MSSAPTYPEPDERPLPPDEAMRILCDGIVRETHGLLPWSSNFTFLVTVAGSQGEVLAIYKPRRGERPLWDFPDGTLCYRETAAYVLSEALGWGLVPPTVLREGPHGIGSVQAFVPHDPDDNYFNFPSSLTDQLKRVALFDHVVNNADRKGGHCLLDATGQLWAIDHGICFHAQPKLRTVIWNFAGDPIPAELLEDVRRLCEDELNGMPLRTQLQDLLKPAEIDAIHRRARRLLNSEHYPDPGPGRHYPWPPV